MDFTRREMLKGMATVGVVNAVRPRLETLASDPVPSFSSLDEIFGSSIVVDDLSGFQPKPSLPDAGFSVVKESGVTVVGPTLGEVEPEIAFHSTVEELGKIAELVSRFPDRMMLIRSFSDIGRTKAEGKLGILANVQNSACIGRDLKNLDLFYSLGLRQIQLTFNWRNWVGDGCTERTQEIGRAHV